MIFVNKGLKQGDAFLVTLFNLALEYILCSIDKTGMLRTRGRQIIAYEDNTAIITKQRKDVREALENNNQRRRKRIRNKYRTNKVYANWHAGCRKFEEWTSV